MSKTPERAKRMSREWQSPNGRWWTVSLHRPGIENLHPEPPAPVPDVGPPHLRFRDQRESGWHFAVPFPQYPDKMPADLSDEEVAGYWRRLVDEKPDFGERGGV